MEKLSDYRERSSNSSIGSEVLDLWDKTRFLTSFKENLRAGITDLEPAILKDSISTSNTDGLAYMLDYYNPLEILTSNKFREKFRTPSIDLDSQVEAKKTMDGVLRKIRRGFLETQGLVGKPGRKKLTEEEKKLNAFEIYNRVQNLKQNLLNQGYTEKDSFRFDKFDDEEKLRTAIRSSFSLGSKDTSLLENIVAYATYSRKRSIHDWAIAFLAFKRAGPDSTEDRILKAHRKWIQRQYQQFLSCKS
jgi:hypothetical protein